jgi:hypothetical protein
MVCFREIVGNELEYVGIGAFRVVEAGRVDQDDRFRTIFTLAV